MKDAGVICHAYTWLPGDPPPYSSVFGEALGEILKPTRACVILSFEDQSGVSGPTGTALDGLVNLFAATADDLITETLFPIDGDGDGETDPFIRKILGVAPKRPPFVYRDTGYGGVNSRTMVIHKSQATDILTGGRSPQWAGALLGNWEGTGLRANPASTKQSPSPSATASPSWPRSSTTELAPTSNMAPKASTTCIRDSLTTLCWRSSSSSIRGGPQPPDRTPSGSTSRPGRGRPSRSTRSSRCVRAGTRHVPTPRSSSTSATVPHTFSARTSASDRASAQSAEGCFTPIRSWPSSAPETAIALVGQ